VNILAIIPARGGSKGLPGKNIKLLNGKPLIGYTIEHALEADRLTKVVVSTDDTEIRSMAIVAKAEAPFLRPAYLAQDNTPTLPVVQHALQYYLEQGERFDAVCLLQPTTPFRKKGLIDQAIEKFISTGADALVSVVPVPHEFNPHWVFEPNGLGFLTIATGEKEIIPRRQELPHAYARDGAIYLTKSSVILENNSLYGDQLTYIENDPEYYVNIDTQADWELAEKKTSVFLTNHG
jgi:N-acylneuraminate cytidylyltransferase